MSAPDNEHMLEDLLAHTDWLRRLAEAAAGLNDPYRSLIVLHYYHGRTPTEIAHERGVPAGTIRAQLSRALEKLCRELSEGERGMNLAVLLPLLRIEQTRPAAEAGFSTAVAVAATILGLATLALGGNAALEFFGKAPLEPAESSIGATPAADAETRDATKAALQDGGTAGGALDDRATAVVCVPTRRLRGRASLASPSARCGP